MEQTQVKKRRWLNNDKATFMAIYPTSTIEQLREKFPGRSDQSFYLLASKLKLKKVRGGLQGAIKEAQNCALAAAVWTDIQDNLTA